MRSLTILMVLACIVTRSLSRPQRADESGEREVEEAEYESADDDSEAEDVDALVNEQEAAEGDQQEESAQNQHLNPKDRIIPPGNNPGPKKSSVETRHGRNSDEKPDNAMEPDNEYQPHPKQNPSNRYSENEAPNNDQEEKSQDVNDFKLIQNEENALNKRSRTAPNDEGDFLFENHQGQADKGDKSAYNNDAVDPNEEARNIKQHYNTKQAEYKGLRGEKRYKDQDFYLDRGRRHAQEADDEGTLNSSSNPAENESLENTATEDEEAAIKRHVKRLSGQELQELLSSLSEDKRELLKKIMENDSESNDKISKREITKKAGTAEENNNLIENALADSSKLQEGSSPLDINTDAPQNSPASGMETKQPEPQTDINDLGVMKTFSSNNSAISPENTVNSKAHVSETCPLKSDSLNSNINPEDSKNQPNIDSNGQSHKIENKREINSDNNSDDNSNLDMYFEDSKMFDNELKDSQECSNDQGYYCPQDKDSSQIIDDEAQPHSIDGNSMKRDAYADREADFSDSIKSLEESFPNSIPYDESDPYSGSDMAPLVRVKRKNDLMIKKRAAAAMSDAKVAYFPYRAENDDEDNDEGNEFDDDGFYDRTSNLENRNVNDKPVEEESPNYDSPNRRLKTSNRNPPMNMKRAKVSQFENMESDTVNLGSDTDSVLSGVEGVDENLMYNSGSRNRRVPGLNPGEQAVRQQRSTPLAEDEGTPAAEQNNAPNYQENDAFGPLPRNYEGDLGRYKRIRRVKQQGASQEDSVS